MSGKLSIVLLQIFLSHIMHIFNIESCDATSDTVFLYVHKAFTRSRMSFNEIESRENVFFSLSLSSCYFSTQCIVYTRGITIACLYSLTLTENLKLKVLSLSKLLIHIFHVSQYMCDYSQLSSWA